MKYQLVASDAVEEQALRAGDIPLPMFDTLLPLIQARAIVAGVRLRIFEAIGKQSWTAEDLAQRLSLDTECLEFVLRVLLCAGYVTRQGSKYQLSQLAQNTLLPDSQARLSAFVEWNYFTWDWIEHLEEVLKTGKGVDAHKTLGPPENWAIYQRAMLEGARTLAPGVAALVPIREGARKLLDIGGAHGLYGALICRLHPPMRSEVLDLPEAVEHGRKLAREGGISDIVVHRSGNALKGDLGTDYDAVFVAATTHHFTRDQNLDLFRRAKAALTRGGTLAIWDFERPDPEAEPELAGDALALFFRLTSTAQCYRAADYTGWLSAAGFTDIQVHPTPFAPSWVLVSGRAH